MKVLVWCATAEACRVFEQYNMGRIEFEYTPDTLTEENVSSCKGYEGIVIQTRCMITEKVAALLAEAGVIFIACRSAGFVLVNPARGGLFDHQAVLEGLKEGKIGALAMDVYEDEKNYLRKDLKGESTGDAVFDQLISREDVIYTAHTAFYTDRAIFNMIETTVENLWEYGQTGSCAHELT